ncbi:sigma-54-dependent transcriptional regulator [Paracidovorax valerianellae]|uniref:Two-component system, NtrC family, response regulator n=1 Tax=Paracidovorax valerianellae TaxID=187868 RepID=A0A1G6ZK85_9BURK|nr:sigma-54 dependent transcriptional regulator [Paracidovorax valerianellae]MDA8444313.1 sigma-54 dependent transcriptional regulator [Paracidovorax valerianellae]SDE01986.1 two-component system, NtrC family, response regulator [Paracidovorax valerianellae]
MTPSSPLGHILLVDDEPAYQRLGSSFLRELGHRVTVAGSGEEAAAAFAEDRAHVVLLDLAMPPSMDPEAGLDFIERFAGSVVVVLSGHGDREFALRAAEKGAWDFLTKPIDPDMLRFVVSRAMHKARLDAELRELRSRDEGEDLGIVGQSTAAQQLRAMVRRVAGTSVNVMVLGPTGTGKELVARALHHCSARKHGPFAVIHCGALSSELLESELFGHLKGSFTGAHRDQQGLVETAHGGTLFLDEVGEMPPAMQVKLLRFLQEGTFLPVGGRTMKKADVRVVSATHRNLEAMIQEGSFREDLFYRLKGVVMRIPPLTERGTDVPLLAAHFLRRVAPDAVFAQDAQVWLAAQNWPGNVRQLRALVESAGALIAPGSHRVDMDVLRFASGDVAHLPEPGNSEAMPVPPAGALDSAIAELENRMIREAMDTAGGNQSEAARRLGISRAGLIKKLTRLGLR